MDTLTFHAGERSLVVPLAIRRPRHVDLGGMMTFVGCGLDQHKAAPGAALHLTLNWQVARAMHTSNTVFVHLLDSQERICGQVGSPAWGMRSTAGWLAGVVLRDAYNIPVSPPAAPEVGPDHTATGAQLPARIAAAGPRGR